MPEMKTEAIEKSSQEVAALEKPAVLEMARENVTAQGEPGSKETFVHQQMRVPSFRKLVISRLLKRLQ